MTSVRTAPLQASLFGSSPPAIDPTFAGIERIELAHGAWIERLPGWLAGDQTVFDSLAETTQWHADRRPMYDRMVDVPRLTALLPRDGPGHPVLDEIAAAVSDRTGEPCERIGLAWYRDGTDSVAPHGDQIARNMHTTTMAIVSCGARRRFHLTPTDPGTAPSRSLHLGRGDLLVMGGTIQRTWRHGVPKTARPVGPRLSIMFRPPWLGRRSTLWVCSRSESTTSRSTSTTPARPSPSTPTCWVCASAATGPTSASAGPGSTSVASRSTSSRPPSPTIGASTSPSASPTSTPPWPRSGPGGWRSVIPTPVGTGRQAFLHDPSGNLIELHQAGVVAAE